MFRKSVSHVIKVLFPIMFILVMNIGAFCQMPVISVRFSNPDYNRDNREYCLDVEFQSDTPDQTLFAMNIRFFYDDDILEFKSMENFSPGYGPINPNPPIVSDGSYIRGLKTLGFLGPPEYVNSSMQLMTPKSLPISISEWTRLFTICFDVDNPEAFDGDQSVSFIRWDLKEYPEVGSYLPGSEGVVITLVTLFPHQSKPAVEKIIYDK